MHQIHTVVNEKYALRASDGKLVVFDKDRDDESASKRSRERLLFSPLWKFYGTFDLWDDPNTSKMEVRKVEVFKERSG